MEVVNWAKMRDRQRPTTAGKVLKNLTFLIKLIRPPVTRRIIIFCCAVIPLFGVVPNVLAAPWWWAQFPKGDGTNNSDSPFEFRVANAFVGWIPGGLAIVTLLTCAFFTAFTGASGVTIIALGGLLYPILIKEKYDDKFSMGLVTSCGSLGLLFPPSLPLMLYGLIATVSIDNIGSPLGYKPKKCLNIPLGRHCFGNLKN